MSNEDISASLFAMFDTNPEAETGGVWADIGPARFKLARMGGANTKFSKTATKRLKPFQASMDNLPDKVATDMAVEIFIDTVLLDWQNVIWTDGTPMEFSKANAKKLLVRLPNLFLALQNEAGKLSNFNAANLEAAAGN
jgi:hypothetical protein